MRSYLPFYRFAFDIASEGIFQASFRGGYIHVNAAMARMFGYTSPNEMIDSVEDIAQDIFVLPDEYRRFQEELKTKGAIDQFRTLQKRKNGTIFWVSYRAYAIRDSKGRLRSYIGFVQDITQQKNIELVLERVDSMLPSHQSLLENLPAAIYIDTMSQDPTIGFYISSHIKTISGYSPTEWSGRGFWAKVIHPDDYPSFERENERTDRTGDRFDMEYRLIHKDGHIVWVRDIATAVCDPKGKPIYWQGIMVDITAQKRLEETIRHSESRFRKVFHNSPVAICITTLEEGIFLDANKAYLTLFGVSREQLIGRSIVDLGITDAATRARWVADLQAAGGLLRNQLFSFLTMNGEVLQTLAFYEIVELEGKKAILSMFNDITPRVQAERALRKSEERYRALVEKLPGIVLLRSAENTLVTLYISPQVETILGYTSEEWLADPEFWEKALHPLDREHIIEKIRQATQQQKPFHAEYRMLSRYGAIVWIYEQSHLIYSNGHPTYWQGFLLDITSKREVQEALGEVAEVYRGLFDSIQEAIYVQDWNGRILDASLGAAKMYGYPREAFLGKTLLDFAAPDKNDINALRQASEQAFEGIPQQVEFWGQRSNGEIFPQEARFYKGNYFGQDVIFVIAQDITERKKAQEALERRLRELSILHELALEAGRILNEDKLIKRAGTIIQRILSPDRCTFILLSNDERYLYVHPASLGHSGEQQTIYPIEHGTIGAVVITGQPVRVHDTRRSKHYPPLDAEMRSVLCVPMKIGQRVIGVINLESARPGQFTEDDERLLTTIAGQLGPAIERLRTERAEREQRLLAEALRDIASALNSTLDFNTVLDRILENIGRVVPSLAASIMLIEDDMARPIRHRGFSERGLGDWMDSLRLDCRAIPNLRRILETGLPDLIPDTHNCPEWIVFPQTAWIRSYLAAPIKTDHKIIGLLSLDHDQPNFFQQQDAERLVAFANQAASAIENARRYEEEVRRARIIETLAEIANLIATNHDTEFLINEIAQRSLQLLRARNVAVYLMEEDNQTLKVVAAKGDYSQTLLSHTITVGQGITGHVVQSGRAEIIPQIDLDPRRRHIPGTPQEEPPETMMSAPLWLRDKVIGAINAWRLREHGVFTETELNFLVSIAHQISIAIEAGRLFQELARRAREAEAIAEVGRQISATLDLNVVLERIATYAKELLRAETSAVYIAEPNSTHLHAVAALGKDAEALKNDPLSLGHGILGNVALQKRGEMINNAESDPRALIVQGTEATPFEHIMGVPILIQDELTGLLAVWRTGPGQEFNPAELTFLTNLAQQAAIAIQNARLFHAEQQRRQEAETLREATAIVAATLDLNRTIQVILDQLAKVLEYDSASIQLLRNGWLEIVGGHGWPSDQPLIGMGFQIPGDNPNTLVIQQRRPLIVNVSQSPHLLFRQPPHHHIKHWLGVPLIARGETIGMLTVERFTEDAFNEEHIRLVTAYANQAAIAIDNAQLHEQLEKQIRRLTSLREIDIAIASSFDIRVTLAILLENALSQLRADAMSVLIHNSAMQALETVASLGFRNPLRKRRVHLGEELAGQVGIQRKPLQLHQISQLPQHSYIPWLAEEEFSTYIAYPLISKGQLKGVLEAFFRTTFSPDRDWLDYMQTLAGQAAIAVDNTELFENLQRTNQELALAYDTTLEGWGRALELRDEETEGHTRRVAELTIRLARRINLSDSELVHIRRGALLHDIGKMAIPDRILRKTGPLDDAEWELMHKHPIYAYQLLYPITYLRPALDIPLYHHEKWDGTGYPYGLKGEQIPLPARIFAVVDVWDALLSDRPYRKTWSREQAMEYVRNEAGSRFDPRVVEVFLKMIEEENI